MLVIKYILYIICYIVIKYIHTNIFKWGKSQKLQDSGKIFPFPTTKFSHDTKQSLSLSSVGVFEVRIRQLHAKWPVSIPDSGMPFLLTSIPFPAFSLSSSEVLSIFFSVTHITLQVTVPMSVWPFYSHEPIHFLRKPPTRYWMTSSCAHCRLPRLFWKTDI